MPDRYFQLGGKGGHTQQWFSVVIQTRGRPHNLQNIDQLALAVAGPASPLRKTPDGPIELILGVRQSGATCLLLTSDQAYILSNRLCLTLSRQSLTRSDFLSLSPISFPDEEELAKKLKTFLPKGKHPGQDDSPANKVYMNANDGQERAYFENARLFFGIMKKELDPRTFSVSDSWAASLRIFSLVFTTWSMDHRRREERLRDPKLLDVGWVELVAPQLTPKPETATHLIPSENSMLSNASAEEFKHGETEKLQLSAVRERVRNLFENEDDGPWVLLVNHEPATCHFLKYCGINDSRIVWGVKGLLEDGDPTFLPKHCKSEERSLDYGRNQYDHRGRSQSPHRHHQTRRSQSPRRDYPEHRPRSPRGDRPNSSHTFEPRREGLFDDRRAPIYLMDVLTMSRALTKSGDLNDGLHPSLSKLASVIYSYYPLKGWCAGNECHALVDLWQSMAAGLPIDEQGSDRAIKVMVGAPPVGAEGKQVDQSLNRSHETMGVPRGMAVPQEDDWEDDDSE